MAARDIYLNKTINNEAIASNTSYVINKRLRILSAHGEFK